MANKKPMRLPETKHASSHSIAVVRACTEFPQNKASTKPITKTPQQKIKTGVTSRLVVVGFISRKF
jgi:hypothetical protein